MIDLFKIQAFGVLEYPPKKIINILEVEDESAFMRDFYNPLSDIYKAYQRGKDKADYAVDKKLFDLAKSGDIEALIKLEDRKLARLQTESKREMLSDLSIPGLHLPPHSSLSLDQEKSDPSSD
jgi:hypothetical protein